MQNIESSKKVFEFDVEKIRNDFPILEREINNKKLVYLDNAATVQKPQAVIDAISNYYKLYNSNVHRGVHTLSQEASHHYELARIKAAAFIGAKSAQEIIFTKGTTDGINLVAQSFVKPRLQKGNEIVLTMMEHHSNIIPWQMIAEEKEAVLKIAPISESGELVMDEFEKLISKQTKIIALTHVSNTMGTINNVSKIIEIAKQNSIPVLIDGAQSAPHMQVDVAGMDCDFYVFSGHKVYGPTGIGVLYAKEEHINSMPPYQGGGGIISTVTFDKTTYVQGPLKFEAGTPNIEGAIGLAAAFDYCNNVGMERIFEHETMLLKYANSQFKNFPQVKIIGTSEHKAGVISFALENIHPFDIGTLLDKFGIAVRTGHHCTQPLMNFFNVAGTTRMSFGIYNTTQEIDYFFGALEKVLRMLS
ncbi:MAG: aminotransferase class V-fold PLP-dependent enzyme [Bacteroidota bacterium]|jgi:cysteine desulfurase/selenocysteine lyase